MIQGTRLALLLEVPGGSRREGRDEGGTVQGFGV